MGKSKVKFIVSLKLTNSETEVLPEMAVPFETTLQRYLLSYNVHFEHPHRNTKSTALYAVYTVVTEVHQVAAVFYLGKLIEGEAGILQLFDEGVESFSFHVE